MSTCNVLTRQEVESVFHETGIIRGYRQPNVSWQKCLCSIYEWHNETINIWTHLLGTFFSLGVFLRIVQEPGLVHQKCNWPFIAFAASFFLCPLQSFIAHTFSNHSATARHAMFLFDYLAISLGTYSYGSALREYTSPEWLQDSFFDRNFHLIAGVITLMCNFTSCVTRFMPRSVGQKGLRLFAFAFCYLTLSLPLFIFIQDTWGKLDDADAQHRLQQHLWHLGSTTIGITLYSSHIPESILENKFDFIGQSHQIFHCFCIISGYFQIKALLQDLKAIKHHRSLESINMDFDYFVFTVAFDCLITCAFLISLKFQKLHYRSD